MISGDAGESGGCRTTTGQIGEGVGDPSREAGGHIVGGCNRCASSRIGGRTDRGGGGCTHHHLAGCSHQGGGYFCWGAGDCLSIAHRHRAGGGIAHRAEISGRHGAATWVVDRDRFVAEAADGVGGVSGISRPHIGQQSSERGYRSGVEYNTDFGICSIEIRRGCCCTSNRDGTAEEESGSGT